MRHRHRLNRSRFEVSLITGIVIIRVIPSKDLRIIRSIAPSIQVDTDWMVGEYLVGVYLRGNILAGISVLEFVVVVWIVCSFIGILCEVPYSGINIPSYPCQRTAVFESANQRTVMVNHKELILFTIPYTGIQDNLVSCMEVWIRDRYLIRIVHNEIFVSIL